MTLFPRAVNILFVKYRRTLTTLSRVRRIDSSLHTKNNNIIAITNNKTNTNKLTITIFIKNSDINLLLPSTSDSGSRLIQLNSDQQHVVVTSISLGRCALWSAAILVSQSVADVDIVVVNPITSRSSRLHRVASTRPSLATQSALDWNARRAKQRCAAKHSDRPSCCSCYCCYCCCCR